MPSLAWNDPLLAKFAFNAQDQAKVEALIASIDKAVDHYCNRRFAQADYDELLRVLGNSEVLLPAYPVTVLYRVMFDRYDVFAVRSPGSLIANCSTTKTYLWLQYLVNGVFTPVTLNYTDYPTLSALAAAANAITDNNGNHPFTATVISQYGGVPSSDLIEGQNGDAHTGVIFGVWSNFATPQYYCDYPRGLLRLAYPWNAFGYEPDFSTPLPGYTVTRDRVRVKWNGGFATYPDDLKLCIAELVGFYADSKTGIVASETFVGSHSINLASDSKRIPATCQVILNQYKDRGA